MMTIQGRAGPSREICGARMKRPPEGHGHLICSEPPGHETDVHVAHDASGVTSLGCWREGQ